MVVSDAKKKANLKWNNANKEQMKYLRYRSYSNTFIGIMAKNKDLSMINEIMEKNENINKHIMFMSKDDCLKLLKKHLKNTCNDKKERKKVFKHSKRVLDICEEIISHLDLKKHFRRMIYRAAIFHDIAKFDNNDIPHNEKAKEILEKKFNKKDDDDFEKICLIIKYHRDEFTPNEDIAILAAILRIADKIDKFNKINIKKKDIEKIEKIYEKNLEEIEKYFKNNKFKHFNKFRKACEEVKEDIKENL